MLLLLLATLAVRPLLWHDPGPVEKLDFAAALDFPVQPPSPPFRFDREDLSGTQPKLFLRDANGVIWNVKFGAEVKPEAFCWRIVRACGYFVEPNFYVREGRIDGLPALKRPSASLSAGVQFHDARFQWRTPEYRFVREGAWSWDDNPFSGTRQLKGLKILLMLLSNFDNKYSRVGPRGGPNTGRFHSDSGTTWYSFTDWGSAMGRWGDRTGQTAWRCSDFSAQTTGFVQVVARGRVRFAYEGHIPHFNDGIGPADVKWLYGYLSRITDDQLRAGLKASGATPEEQECFTHSIRARIEQLNLKS
jgi:hypothetical protein